MPPFRHALACLLASALCLPADLAWADGDFDRAVRDLLGGDPAAYRTVIATFQKALQTGDAATAATLVHYPIDVEVDGEKRVVRGPAEFAAAYQRILPPDLVAAVAGEPVEAMALTVEGVMLGQGEIWISAICEDDACTEEPVRVVAIQPAVPPAKALVGKLQPFRDWVLGCDNRLACSLVGVAADDGTAAYAVLRRAAGSAAAPEVLLVLTTGQPRAETVSVSVSGGNGTRTWGPYPMGDHPGGRAAHVPDAEISTLIAALKAGDRMTLLPDGAAGEQASPLAISLRGTAAALLAMDERQGRVGTETALTRPGPLPASAVPGEPTVPDIEDRPIRQTSRIPRPEDAPADPAPGCETIPPLGFDLGKGAGLWARCVSAGAYNILYEFWLVRDGAAEPARFDLPGRTRDDPHSLFAPTVGETGRSLRSRYLGRGAGDCGVITDWAWTGEAFVPLRVREMDACSGVAPEDWPVLWAVE